jgi:hypothetical protein
MSSLCHPCDGAGANKACPLLAESAGSELLLLGEGGAWRWIGLGCGQEEERRRWSVKVKTERALQAGTAAKGERVVRRFIGAGRQPKVHSSHGWICLMSDAAQMPFWV